MFPQYPEMARKLFAFLVTSSGGPASSHVISYSNFKAQTERLLSVLADDRQVLMYVMVSKSLYLFVINNKIILSKDSYIIVLNL